MPFKAKKREVLQTHPGEKPERSSTVYALPVTSLFTRQNGEAVRKHEIRERGVSEDSSLRLNAPENAVKGPTVSFYLEHGAPTVSLETEGASRRLIVDTGSNVSILQSSVSRSDMRLTP